MSSQVFRDVTLCRTCQKTSKSSTEPPLPLRSMQDPGLLQDQFPCVSIISCFSPASNTRIFFGLFSTLTISWLSNRPFTMWGILELRETLDQEPILNYIDRRSIRWYGHVVRMQDYREPKQAVVARREKRRGRGRPRKTWKDCV